MESFSRGWNFLKQAWQMAFKDKDLLKPSIYSLVVGGIVAVLGIIPIILAALILGTEGTSAQIVLFVLGAILIFVQFIVSYIFSAMTVYLIYGYLSEGDGRMDKAWAIVKRDLFDIATLAAASTVVNLIKNAANKNKKGIGAAVARAGAGLLDTLWTEAALLVLPAMVIDDLNLKKGLERVWQITKSNFLLIGISTVGVKWATGLIGFVLGIIGAGIGVAIGGGLTYISGGDATLSIIGIAVGVLIFFFFVVIASVINSYTSTAYHTCLYIWAREVEKAQEQGQAMQQVAAPAPLAAVLG
jgi:membrane-anchored glycerophosphoryl diester phosphodiesterase (GDPDase)